MRIARDLIDPDAYKVVTRLAQKGYQAYLVGGCVRDLLLRRSPKDFDVSTNATPSEIKYLFRNCRIIGRRFRLAHVFFGQKIIETSTFRANPRQDDDPSDDEELLIRRDNVFGNATEDAKRRDFTINGLFYDVEAENVIDHVDGLRDLNAGLVRTIGDPDIRFREDPVRMMRAIKFAARLGFEMEPNTLAALVRQSNEISKCSPPRVLEEFFRLLKGTAARRSMELLVQTRIAQVLSPHLAGLLGGGKQTFSEDSPDAKIDTKDWTSTWNENVPQHGVCVPEPTIEYLSKDEIPQRRDAAWDMLSQLDKMVIEGKKVSNSLALAALCSSFILPELESKDIRPSDANEHFEQLIGPMIRELRLVRRDTERTRQLLLVQKRLTPESRKRGKPMALVRREYFADALFLYEMIGASKGDDQHDPGYWRKYLGKHSPESSGRSEQQKKRRRRGGRRRRGQPPNATKNNVSS